MDWPCCLTCSFMLSRKCRSKDAPRWVDQEPLEGD